MSAERPPEPRTTSRAASIERLLGEERQEPDRVEQVRLARPVDPGDTGERPEADVHVHQVLETVHLQPGQHRTLQGNQWLSPG